MTVQCENKACGEDARPYTTLGDALCEAHYRMALDSMRGDAAGTYRLGQTIRACYLRQGHMLALEPGSVADCWRMTRTLRDSVPVIVRDVKIVRMGSRRAYRILGVTTGGLTVWSLPFYGQNAIHTIESRNTAR